MKDRFNLLKCPFSFDIEEASTDLQLELIDLQADHTLKEGFKNMKSLNSLHHSAQRSLVI